MSVNGTKNSFENLANKDLLKNPKLDRGLSWPVIIIVTIIFWPIGVFLIWRRISVDKKTAMLSGRIILTVGWVSIALAVLGLLVGISRGMRRDDVTMIIFFIVAGISLILLGKNTKKNAEKFKKYISIIINKEIISIDNISAAMPTSYDVCKKDLQKMIDKGYFDGAYIDESAREIILPKYNNNITNECTDNNIETHIVVCKGCGANNSIVKGSVGECEFCGSPIS